MNFLLYPLTLVTFFPLLYLAAHQEAIRLKLARLGNTGIQAQKRTPAAAVPGAITGGASVQKFSELTPDQQWELAKKSR